MFKACFLFIDLRREDPYLDGPDTEKVPMYVLYIDLLKIKQTFSKPLKNIS